MEGGEKILLQGAARGCRRLEELNGRELVIGGQWPGTCHWWSAGSLGGGASAGLLDRRARRRAASWWCLRSNSCSRRATRWEATQAWASWFSSAAPAKKMLPTCRNRSAVEIESERARSAMAALSSDSPCSAC